MVASVMIKKKEEEWGYRNYGRFLHIKPKSVPLIILPTGISDTWQ